jgi:hypothetical protein
MQFKVPQFLDIEDKIFGPFTFRQFVYLAGGAGLCFILYRLLGFFWSAIPVLIVAAFSLALTFYRPNNKPFINMVEAMFKFATKDKLYVWDRLGRTNSSDGLEKKAALPALPKRGEEKLTKSRLKDLAWSLDVLDMNKQKNQDEQLPN